MKRSDVLLERNEDSVVEENTKRKSIKNEYEPNTQENPPRIPRKFTENSFPGQSDAQAHRIKRNRY